jgi:SAM-dependent methyltransferase
MYINRWLPVKLRRKFDKVFQQNLFFGQDSKSGNGSSVVQTAVIAKALPGLTSKLGVRTFLDVPCGDLTWMSKVSFVDVEYIGCDVAPSLISHLQEKYADRYFQVLDITRDNLPTVDMIFCRDLFVHLSNREIRRAITAIKQSGSGYLATTTFIDRKHNSNLPLISRGIAWRPLNLELAPFAFPAPVELIIEECTENNGDFQDKAIAVWKIKDLP